MRQRLKLGKLTHCEINGMHAIDILPLGFILAGISALLYQTEAGLLFCRIGKWTWRISTFGLTDMRWFYPEDRARRIGLKLGLMFCLFGICFGTFSLMSLSGPNSFAAMRQAQDYLKKSYGASSNGYSFSCRSVPGAGNDVIVHYEYSGKVGDLRGSWDGSQYKFSEEHQ